MTPGARIQSSIELLGSILDSWKQEKRFPADKSIDNYFKARRFIGSKDRAAIGELTYWCLRHLAALKWYAHSEESRRLILTALVIREEFDGKHFNGMQYSPQTMTAEEKKFCHSIAGKKIIHRSMPDPARLNYPEWMESLLKENFGSDYEAALAALSAQAPTDLRVNTLKTTREKLQKALEKEKFEVIPTPISPIGLRLKRRMPIFTSEFFKKGHFEVQDEGSQVVAQLVDAEPGHKVIDFCAGAGGKTLAIAAQMQNKGRILAWDTSQKRLLQIKDRLKRAGVDNVQTHVIENENDQFIKRHKASADRVLVDAPCSGTGTWRRNPDLKWRFTQKDLDEVLALQKSILESAARLVSPGGRLIYATCSLLAHENENQLDRLLTSISDFRVVSAEKIWDKSGGSDAKAASYLWLTPHREGVDGFFAAVLERKKTETK